jgi:hypothetical protein
LLARNDEDGGQSAEDEDDLPTSQPADQILEAGLEIGPSGQRERAVPRPGIGELTVA